MSDEQRPAPIDGGIASLDALRARTASRVFAGRAGSAYRTATQLALRQDHAAALDAVHAEVSLERDFDAALLAKYALFEVATHAANKAAFLQRPDLGRRLSDTARSEIVAACPRLVDLQVVLGDGLSAVAVVKQAPALLRLLDAGCVQRQWKFGRPFFVRHCRVGVLNDIGELLDPAIVVLLIGERPGLATADSLSAYLAYRPRSNHTDAQRNLISNIHAGGIAHESAAARIFALAAKMREAQTSGVAIKEDLLLSGRDEKVLPHTQVS